MPIQGLDEFNADLTRATSELLPREVRTEQIKLARRFLRGVVRRTKAVSGRARGNWQVTVGEPAEGEVEADKSIGSVMSKGYAALNALQNYDRAWITNNVPYIGKLDRGHITRRGRVKAPRGIVAATIAEVNSSVEV